MKHPASFILLLFLFTCSACSTISQKIHPTTIENKTAESELLVAALKYRNESLRTFKGIGKINIVRNGHSFTSKVAWLGSSPENLRVELIGSPGQPKIGFSCDGQWIYYYDHQDNVEPVKRIPASHSMN